MRPSAVGLRPRLLLRRAGLPLAALALALALALPALATAAPGYANADYFRFADRIASQLNRTWSHTAGYYRSNAPGIEAQYNAALLTIHATAAAYGHDGPARNDERAREIARRLTTSPPFYTGGRPPGADSMFHSPGWTGNLEGAYQVMDKAIDPKVAEGLQIAYRARAALGLPDATAAAILDEIHRVAHSRFFRFPSVRLNQINWPLELAAYDMLVSGDPGLLRTQYRLQAGRFVAGIRRPRFPRSSGSATNLSPSYRFHREPGQLPSSPTNVDSAEYANIVVHFLGFYDEARRAGMAPLPAADMQLLRGWVQRDLFGYWTHAGFLNWDTGLGFRRWMKGKFWAYAQQGLLAIADARSFHNDPRYGTWAKTLFDRGLGLYDRMAPPSVRPRDLPQPGLFRVRRGRQGPSDQRMFAARMGANAVRAISTGLGRMAGSEPPPFYAFDADIGRLAVSTPAYATAVTAVNRGAFSYGGIELARLYDGDGDVIAGIGGRPPAAFGVLVRDRAGHRVLASQTGLRRDPRRPPVVLARSPRGSVTRLAHLPARPAAGPFRVLEAVGQRRSRDLRVITRHRFGARSIVESWQLRRVSGRRFYSAAVVFPSWGANASIDAMLADGSVLALAGPAAPAAEVALSRVRRFEVRSRHGSYSLEPLGRPLGTARAVRVGRQDSNPNPGPTLELTLRSGTAFRSAALQARITPHR